MKPSILGTQASYNIYICMYVMNSLGTDDGQRLHKGLHLYTNEPYVVM